MDSLRERIVVAVGRQPVVAGVIVALLLVWVTTLVLSKLWNRTRGGSRAHVLRPYAPVHRSASRRGVQFKTLRLVKCIPETPDTRRFTFEWDEDETLAPARTYGRVYHVSVSKEVNGTQVVRPYTPVTSPWKRGSLDIVVKFYEYGTLTPELFKLQPGETLQVRAAGGMKYTPNEHKHVLLLAAGSGVTPFVQLLTNSLAYGKPDTPECIKDIPEDHTKMTLLFQNRTTLDIILRSHLEELAQRSEGRLQVAFFVSQGGVEPADGGANNLYNGYINSEAMERYAADAEAAFVCGPPRFMGGMQKLCTDAGIERVRRL